MRGITRPEFQAYEKRVEDALDKIGKSIEDSDRKDFEEIAAAARQVVEVRRAHLEISEQQAAAELGRAELEKSDQQLDDRHDQPAEAGSRYYEQTAEASQEALTEIKSARAALGRAEANLHSELSPETYRDGLDRGLWRAANLAVEWDNKYVLEAAQDDKQLADRIALLEKMWDEHDVSYSAGSAGEPIPEIAKGDAKLLGYYKEGLEDFKSDLAIADAENGLAYGGWGPPAGYWNMEDSEAAWAKFDHLRDKLHEAQASLTQGVERQEAETPSSTAANDPIRDSHYDSDHAAQSGRSSDQVTEATHQARVREDAVARYGEKAVAAGEDLLARLVAAGDELRGSEARYSRTADSFGYRASDEERDARFENLMEAEANYNRALRQAAREAVDGNGYILEARWHRDLELSIAMESLRREQSDQFYGQSEYIESSQSPATERVPQQDDAAGSGAVHQPVTRLSQIEQDIRERHRTDRDDRDR